MMNKARLIVNEDGNNKSSMARIKKATAGQDRLGWAVGGLSHGMVQTGSSERGLLCCFALSHLLRLLSGG